MSLVTAVAYAKINLTLDILAKRPDGYHDLRSIMQTISLHDTVEIRHTPDQPGVGLTVTGSEGGGVPAGESNLVHRAAVRLQQIAAARAVLPLRDSGLQIALTKRIPSQAGLGGGSSDAAAAIKAISRLFGLKLSLKRTTEIAASLGADVPFFLTGGTALIEGLGERVTPLSAQLPEHWAVIVKPPVGVSTAAAYAALDALPYRVPGTATDGWSATRHLALSSDFQEVVRAAHPEIAAAFDALRSERGLGPLLCGSGAAVFTLFESASDAEALADRMHDASIGTVWVVKTQGRDR